MRALDLFALYGTSYFAPRDFLESPSFASKADVVAALDDYNADPGAAFLSNIEQARKDVRATAERLQRAKYDGLLDSETFDAATKREQRTWVECVAIVRGDYQRAVAELAHWRGYAADHLAGRMPAPRRGGLRDIIRQLADSKSMPDDEGEVPF